MDDPCRRIQPSSPSAGVFLFPTTIKETGIDSEGESGRRESEGGREGKEGAHRTKHRLGPRQQPGREANSAALRHSSAKRATVMFGEGVERLRRYAPSVSVASSLACRRGKEREAREP
ncbi:hypothetical protein MTO96_031191 [Rhipicephalus appendiculatus]